MGLSECSMGKRSEGNPHAAFDEGEGGEVFSPLCYSTGLKKLAAALLRCVLRG